jgi:hypothetical protein
MFKKVLKHCAAMSFWKVLSYGLILAVAFEAFTMLCRFGLNLQSTRDTGAIGAFTFGLRIHHGYIGLFLVPLAWCFPLGLRHALWMVAIGLILSDLAHHFLVLWPLTGSPQFDIVYPQHPSWSRQ